MPSQRRKPRDSDNPELTVQDFARAKRGIEHLPGPMRQALEGAMKKRRGRGPQKAPTKQLVALRLSRDVVETYRSTGQGWQARIDATLQRAARAIKRRKTSAG